MRRCSKVKSSLSSMELIRGILKAESGWCCLKLQAYSAQRRHPIVSLEPGFFIRLPNMNNSNKKLVCLFTMITMMSVQQQEDGSLQWILQKIRVEPAEMREYKVSFGSAIVTILQHFLLHLDLCHISAPLNPSSSHSPHPLVFFGFCSSRRLTVLPGSYFTLLHTFHNSWLLSFETHSSVSPSISSRETCGRQWQWSPPIDVR